MHKKKLIASLLFTIVVAYIGFCLAVYFCPQYFFYNPDNKKADLAEVADSGFAAKEIVYNAQDGTELYGWLVEPRDNKKLIVFYHGNSYNIAKFVYKLRPLVAKGYGIFIGEYRGFGGVQGKITQTGLEQDALAVITKLHELGYKNQQIVIYGMSLGSHTSSYVVANEDKEKFAGLILEVPFDSLLNVVKQRIWPIFPFNFIVKDEYDNIASIEKIDIPVLIMAGSKDTTVPIKRAIALYDAAKQPKEMIIYDGAQHSNLFDFANYKDILRWLDK